MPTKMTAEQTVDLNEYRRRKGQPPVDEYGNVVKGSTTVPKPTSEVKTAVDVSGVGEEAATEIKEVSTEGFSEEKALASQVRDELKKRSREQLDILRDDPEAYGLDIRSPTFANDIVALARQRAIEVAKVSAISPGFPLTEKWEGKKPHLAQVSVDPAAPTELPPAPNVSLLRTALRPQTRIGKELSKIEVDRAKWSYLKTPDDFATAKKLDLNTDAGKQELAGYAGLYKSYQTYLQANPDAEPQTALKTVREDLDKMAKIMRGEGGPGDYFEQKFSEGPKDPLFQSFKTQVTDSGKAPILNEHQRAYLQGIADKRAELYAPDVAAARQEAAEATAVDDPVIEAPGLSSPAHALRAQQARQEAISDAEKEVKAEAGIADLPYWAQANADKIMADPEKFAEGGLWQRDYPTGATVEGPVQWAVRSALILPNLASRGLYEIGEAVGPSVVAGLMHDPTVDRKGFEKTKAEAERVVETSTAAQDELPQNRLYRDHPYLRNVALNRGLMEDSYDLFKYGPEEYQKYAPYAGAAGLLTDILVAPFDPGLSQVVKGGTQAAKTAKVVKTVTGSKKAAASAAWKDFYRTVGEEYLDQTALGAFKRPMDSTERTAAHLFNWISDEQEFLRVYNLPSVANMKPQKRFDLAVKVAAGKSGRGTSRFFDEALSAGHDITMKRINDPKRWTTGAKTSSVEKYIDYLDEMQNFRRAVAKGKAGEVPRPTLTKRLIDSAAERDSSIAKSIEHTDDVVERATILMKSGAWKEVMAPLYSRMAKTAAVDIIENTPLLKGGFSNLTMITPKLFLNPNDIKKLGKLTKDSEDFKAVMDLVKAADEAGAISVGEVPVYRTTAGSGPDMSTRVTSRIWLSDVSEHKDKLARILADLHKRGLLTESEFNKIRWEMLPTTESIATGTKVVEPGRTVPEGYISMDNIRTIMNAQIEDIAFGARLGLSDETLEGASAATKAQLLDVIDARHLRGNWVYRTYKKFADNTKSWGAKDLRGVPPYALKEIEVLKGRLDNIGLSVRKELQDITSNTETQKLYFTEEWLKTNTPTHNDAVVALTFGPLASRSSHKIDSIARKMIEVLTSHKEEVSMDIFAAFRNISVADTSLFDFLSSAGRARVDELMYSTRFDDGGFVQDFSRVQGHADYVKTYESFVNQIRDLVENPDNWTGLAEVPKVMKTALGTNTMSDVTAASMYLSKAIEMQKDTVERIVIGWTGFDNIVRSRTAVHKAYEDMFEMLEDAGLRNKLLASPEEQVYGTRDPFKQITARSYGIFTEPDVVSFTSENVIKEAQEFLIKKAKESSPEEMIAQSLSSRVKTMVEGRANGTIGRTSAGQSVYNDWEIILQDVLGMDAYMAKHIAQRLAENDADLDDFRKVIMQAKESTDDIAWELMRDARLNRGNVNESLANLEIMMEEIGRYHEETTLLKGQPDEMAYGIQRTRPNEAFFNAMISLIPNKDIQKAVLNVRESSDAIIKVRKELSRLYETKPSGWERALGGLDAAMNWMTSARYTMILGSRAAFHAVNIATAPTIIWGTLGGRAAAKSFWNLKKAHQVWQVGASGQRLGSASQAFKNLTRPDEFHIAVIDPLGRSYTYRDIWELAIPSGGLRSQTAIVLGARQYNDIINDVRFTNKYKDYVNTGLAKQLGTAVGAVGGNIAMNDLPASFLGAVAGSTVRGEGLSRFLNDMTEFEDQYFRLTQVIDGLQRGEDPMIALARGKRGLYDYGSLTKPEKWATSRLFMFYSFWRLNTANTMATLLSNPKRFANIYRSTQFPSMWGGYDTSELNFYKHHFLLSRPMIKYIEGSDKTSHYQVLPPVPMLDGMTAVAQMFMAPTVGAMFEGVADKANPELKILMGKPPGLEWKPNVIDPVDMHLLNKSGMYDWFWDIYVKERPQGVPAKAGDLSYNGQAWKLSNEGMKRYKYFKNHAESMLVLPGVYGSDTLPLTQLVLPEPALVGKKFGKEGGGDVLDTLGMVKSIGTLPMTKQREMALREQLRLLQQLEQKGD